jgi:hypothetical protein
MLYDTLLNEHLDVNRTTTLRFDPDDIYTCCSFDTLIMSNEVVPFRMMEFWRLIVKDENGLRIQHANFYESSLYASSRIIEKQELESHDFSRRVFVWATLSCILATILYYLEYTRTY